MAKNPDPNIALTNLSGRTRTLDDWSTMFQLVLVVLPDRPEASAWVPIGKRIFATFGDADCTTAFVVPSAPSVARKILDGAESKVTVFVDPDREFVTSLGLERLPAFVHLRQDTTLASVAEGWDPRAWQRVAREIGKAMAWTFPEVARPTDPSPTDGWPAAAV
jgi:hypothetical protein